MSYEKIARLVKVLCEKTHNQEISWSETEKEGVFETSFPTSSIRIYEGYGYDDEGNNTQVIVFELINENGDVIEKVDDESLKAFLDLAYTRMSDMYDAARRQAMGVEAALDEILNIIDPEIPF